MANRPEQHEPDAGEVRRSAASPLGPAALALYLTGLAAFVGLYLPQPILPLLSREYDVDVQRAALIVSATVFGIAVASPVIGLLADRFGRRRMVMAGSLLLALSTAASAWAPTFESLVAFRFLQGLLLPMLFAAGVAYVSESLPGPLMRQVAGVYVACTIAGGMAGRLLAGAFADAIGWRAGFLVGALLYLSLLPLWARLAADQRAGGSSSPWSALGGMLGHLRNPAILGGLLMGFCLFFAFQSTFNYLPFRLASPPFSFSSTRIGLIYLTYGAGILSSAFAGWLGRSGGLRTGLISGFGLAIAGNLLTLAPGVPLLVAGLLVLCLGNFLVQGLAVGYVATAALNDRAGANALYLLLYYLGGSAGAFLPGFLYPRLGFTGVIACSVLSLMIGLLVATVLAAKELPPVEGDA
jgi:YNFM family putative membrane transporter